MSYKDNYNLFKQVYADYFPTEVQCEFAFEKIQNCDALHTTKEILEKYEYFRDQEDMKVTTIPLGDCQGWKYSDGHWKHHSGDFFKVEGIRVSSNSREVATGWDQPILTQVGYDGGILGFIRQRINEVPHYLIEFKAEPGNYNIIQITTTIQATFANLKKAHGGRMPHFAEYFLEPHKHQANVLFEQWTSEDGGRLYNKRNKSMIVDIDAKNSLRLPNNRFMWVTANQLKNLIHDENAIVSPHARGILSAI